MKNTILFGLVLLLVTGYSLKSQVSGSMDRQENFPSEYVDSRNVDVWLPKGYLESEGKEFPVIYMQDGQNLFDPSTS
nr:esterase [Bacteroidota bacterium]